MAFSFARLNCICYLNSLLIKYAFPSRAHGTYTNHNFVGFFFLFYSCFVKRNGREHK